MKKLILAVTLTLLPLSTSSQSQIIEENLKIYCASTDAIFSGLMDKYKEVPIVGGMSDDTMISFWANNQTKTFTVIATSKDKKVSCVIVSGDNYSTRLKSGDGDEAIKRPNRLY